MHRKQLIFGCTVASFLFSLSTVYALVSKSAYFSQNKITDQQLEDLAIRKLFIPYNHDDAYYKSELERKNTIPMWISADRSKKIGLIDGVKKAYLEEKHAVIKLPASYYVDEINGVLYSCLESGDYSDDLQKGIGVMFKTIALLDGDFDNGESLIKTLRKYAGEELFMLFKDSYPDKYYKLIKLDKERNR